jgi:hypothetical protein
MGNRSPFRAWRAGFDDGRGYVGNPALSTRRKMITREQLFKEYTDWINNYLTIGKFAEHRGLTVAEGQILLELAQSCFENNHPES